MRSYFNHALTDDDVQLRVAKNFWMPLGHHLRFEISLSGKELGAIAGRRGSEDENTVCDRLMCNALSKRNRLKHGNNAAIGQGA